ncbi:4-nitrophenylphosphatase [Monosporozyma servazzii]
MTTSPAPAKITTKDEGNAFFDKFDTFLFDCDGVLWLGNYLLPNTIEFLNKLESLGKQVFFVTNNSTKSRATYKKKFASFGIDVKIEQIFTSGYASAIYVRDFLKLQPGKDKIWVLGESGIGEELATMGFEHLGGTDPRLNEPFNPNESPFLKDGLDPNVRAVVAGLDHDINYHRLAITLQYLREGEDKVKFIGTNIDSTFPQKDHILPGAGSIIASVACSSGRTPIYCGKPNMNMLNSIVSAAKLDKSRVCMVGDRLNTDIRFGHEGNLGGTLLVLSGIETEERALAITEEYPRPTYYVGKLGDIYDLTK